MLVTKEKNVRLFGLWFPLVFNVRRFGLWSPLVFLVIMLAGALVLYVRQWLPGFIVLSGGLLWAFFSFRIVQPAFAGLVFRFGSRVIISETIRYFRIVDGQEQDIPADEFNGPGFDPKAADIKSEIDSVDYLTKKEGWTFVFPILERITQISLRQHREKINERETGEDEDAYLNRAESIATKEGINIFPEIFYSYKIVNPGKVFELGGGIDEDGDSPFLVEMLHDLVIGGTRGVLAKTELIKILSRETEDDKGIPIKKGIPILILIDEKIRTEITGIPNFPRLGVELLIIRIVDIKFKKDAKEVLFALEEIKKKELTRRSQVIEADTRLQVQMKDSETIIALADANLKKARAEAASLNAAIAAFAGKKTDGPTTLDEGKDYARYQIGLAVAKALETGTKVIIPATEASKVIAGLVNVFDSSRS